VHLHGSGREEGLIQSGWSVLVHILIALGITGLEWSGNGNGAFIDDTIPTTIKDYTG